MPRRTLAVVVLLILLGTGAVAPAQQAPARLRLALVSQWVLNQHGSPAGPLPELRRALDDGVVDRVVFAWQRGLIQRRTLVSKPIRVVPAAESADLGGRGAFEVAVQAPSGGSGWTTVEVTRRSEGLADALVLEVGGELGTVTQVLEALWVLAPDGSVQNLPLARRALVPAAGVPVVSAPFGRPVTIPAGVAWSGAAGLEFLVARSPVEVRVNGAITANGLADLAVSQSPALFGDWREGDRVFVRVPASGLAGAPALVLGWKDRIYRPDGGDLENFRGRARLHGPGAD